MPRWLSIIRYPARPRRIIILLNIQSIYLLHPCMRVWASLLRLRSLFYTSPPPPSVCIPHWPWILYTTSDWSWLFNQSTWNTVTWKHDILTVNYKIHLFFSTSRTVVGFTCVCSSIFLADRNKGEVSRFRSRTFHLSIMNPPHIRVWFARRFTADINMSFLVVICIYQSWISDNGWLCKYKAIILNTIHWNNWKVKRDV